MENSIRSVLGNDIGEFHVALLQCLACCEYDLRGTASNENGIRDMVSLSHFFTPPNIWESQINKIYLLMADGCNVFCDQENYHMLSLQI